MEVNCLEDINRLMDRPPIEIIESLQRMGLIKQNKRCPKRTCRQYCSLWQRPHYKLGYAFTCRKCKATYSIFEGSFFENIHLEIKTVFQIMWLWAAECSSSVARDILNLPRKSIYQQYGFLRDICSWKLLQSEELMQLGGPGIIVQVDESVVTKRKYNKGRLIKQQWVIGLFDTTTRKGLIIYIPNRLSKTLIDVIIKHVKPGTEIWTDCWSGYKSLKTLGNVSPYIHMTVNHSENFVDPTTGTCTNMVEGYWSKFKRHLRKLQVMQSQLLPEHIDQFMWKEHVGESCKNRFNNILLHITERYEF